MLNMRITRAPLPEIQAGAILHEYNRLTGGSIPVEEFVHWTTKSPEGPAWHAILETDEGRIVGHTSVFPVRAGQNHSGLIPAKSEYSFLHEDFRKEKIHGYESVSRPAFITLIDKLFQHCCEQGWGPIFASTNEKNQIFTRKVGLRPVEFPLWECLLVLRPGNAAKATPNLTQWQRAALFSSGLVHATAWPLAAKILESSNGIENESMGGRNLEPETKPLSFFEDRESLEWRYLAGQYFRLGLKRSVREYLIAKRGTQERYLRVCQWRLDSMESFASLFAALVRQARQDGAMGVRWAVYDGEQMSEPIVKVLKRMGLLCARRTRIVMIHKNDERFLNPELWNMNDSLFSFDP